VPRFIADSSLSASIKVVYANGDGEYEDLFNEDLIELGLARTTTFSDAYRREFERAREEAEERSAGLWSACPEVTVH
jgi:inner membrane protein